MIRETRCLPSLIPLLAAAALASCDPSGGEPARVSLPVVAAADGIVPCTNDLGWEVTVTAARVALGDLEFTVEGETHARAPAGAAGGIRAALAAVPRLLVPAARAHPGHQAGGEVTGELPGAFLADLVAGTALGQATLLEGAYHGVNLSFRVAGPADGLAPGDALAGHTALLQGTARKEGRAVAFQALLDVQEGLQMVGGPFGLDVTPDTTATLVLTLATVDPAEGDTLFDGLDFGALDDDGDGQAALAPGQAAHNVLAKTLVRHDHWGIRVR